MVTITLLSELEEAISAKARQQGTSPELLVLDVLHEMYLPAVSQARQALTVEKHPPRAQLNADEVAKRMEAFSERKEQIVVNVRAVRQRDQSH